MQRQYYLPVLIALTISLQTSAQFKAGEKFVSGTLTMANSKQSTDRVTNINFSPSLTKFHSDQKATSLKLIFTLISGEQTQAPVKLSFTNYNVGFGISRQKIFVLGKGYYFSTEYGINAVYVWGKEAYRGTGGLPPDAGIKGYNIQLNLRPEIGYRLTNRFVIAVNFSDLLLAGFQQVSQNTGSTGGETQTTFYLNSALANIALGQIGVRFGIRI